MLRTRPIITRETEQVLFCDICSKEINEPTDERIVINEGDCEWNEDSIGYIWGFCKTCAEKTPEDVIEGLTSSNPEKREAASTVVHSIDELDHEYTNPNLMLGNWAFFYNDDADHGEVFQFEDEQGLLKIITDQTLYPRHCQTHLSSVLIDGKLKNYRTVMTLDVGDF